jgi:FAD/FMN-containing dehydrogenase
MNAATSGSSLSIDPNILASYQRRMRGELYAPGALASEATRCAHTEQWQEEPALVACCLSAHDVALAIGLVQELQLELVVHSGGYSQTSSHVNKGGMLIDLSRMRQITIDPLQRIARAEPGATNDELAQAAAEYGLITVGTSATDNVLAFELVTLKSRIITASPYAYPDLFTALCEGINTFGIVTAIVCQLHVSQPI